MLAKLQKLNPDLGILPVESPEFARYGRILVDYDFGPLIDMVKDLPVPANTNTYTPELPATRDLPIYGRLTSQLYGEMPIQIGFGGGFNLALNALEWHQGNEVNVAVSDFVVMLACLSDLADGKLDSAKVKTFYLKRGQAIEIYGTTLHYSPCNVDNGVFRMIVVLPRGTNLPLAAAPSRGSLLAAKNKWLLAHAEASGEIKAGAVVGITGANLRLRV
jgi:hypothetical protein